MRCWTCKKALPPDAHHLPLIGKPICAACAKTAATGAQLVVKTVAGLWGKR